MCVGVVYGGVGVKLGLIEEQAGQAARVCVWCVGVVYGGVGVKLGLIEDQGGQAAQVCVVCGCGGGGCQGCAHTGQRSKVEIEAC